MADFVIRQKGESFESIQKRLLRARIDRLRLFAEKDIAALVAFSVGPVLLAAIGGYGEPVVARLSQMLLDAEKIRLGFCPMCKGSPKPISNEKTPHGESWGMCDGCLSIARETDPAPDAEEGQDA